MTNILIVIALFVAPYFKIDTLNHGTVYSEFVNAGSKAIVNYQIKNYSLNNTLLRQYPACTILLLPLF